MIITVITRYSFFFQYYYNHYLLMKLKWYDLEWEKTDDIYFYLLYFKKNKICFKIASCQIEVCYSPSLILLP